MRVCIISFLLIIMNLSFASVEIDLCRNEVIKHGNGEGNDIISRGCVDLFKKRASAQLVIKVEAMDLEITAVENIIMIQKISDPNSIEFFAGNKTMLDHISAVAFDSQKNELVVLENNSLVLFFNLNRTGNIAPRRNLKSKLIAGSSDLVLNPSRNEVIVLNKDKHSALVFSALANSEGKPGQKFEFPLKRYDGVSATRDRISFDPKSKQVLFNQ